MAENKQQQGYTRPAVCTPSLKRLADIAQDLNLDLTDEELSQYRDLMSHTFSTHYQKVYELPEPKLPVKYTRTPGHRPPRDLNPLNAWYWRCDIQGASSGKLHGKTIAIKDNIPVAGVPMMNGSRMLEGYVPDVDATVVTRVLDAGGRILGKAVSEDFCCSGESFTSATGPVLNPVDKTRSAGGSSSGSAALVAAGDVDMALGGDQGGSIRIPSAACGIVGLKPTFGLVPHTGIAGLEFTIDHCGPMARTVYDTALLLEAIAGREIEGLDSRQPHDLPTPPSYTSKLTGEIEGIRIGLLKEGFSCPANEKDVNELVRKSTEQLKSLRAVVEDVSIPWHYIGTDLLMCIFSSGHARTMVKADASTSNLGYFNTHLQQALARGFKSQPNELSPTLKFVRLMGRYLEEDYHDVFYSKAQNLRRELTKAYDEALANYDVLIMPTVPKKAQKLPLQDITIKEYPPLALSQIPNTCPFNVSGHPALTINAGSSDGLPVGMMIVGRKFDEGTVLNVAYAHEKLRDRTA